jgi:hypothetical protein
LLIGYLASVCSVASFVPQVWKVMKTGDTAAISALMYALTVIDLGNVRVASRRTANHPHELDLLLSVWVYFDAKAAELSIKRLERIIVDTPIIGKTA